VRSLFPILPDEVIGKETLAAARWAEDELITVRHDSLLHRQIRNVEEDGLSRQTVHHADAEGGKRVLTASLRREEAKGLFHEGVETLLGREIGLVARNTRPEERGQVRGVVTGRTLHQGQLTAYVVLYPPKLVLILCPCDDVAVAADGSQAVGMRLVQILVQPFLVDLIRSGIPGERLHILGHLLEAPEILATIINEYPLVVDVVAGQHNAYGRGETEAAIASVGRKTLITSVGLYPPRQVVEIREGMQAKAFVADAHLRRIQLDVLQHTVLTVREGQVAFYQSGMAFRSGDFPGCQSFQTYQSAVVDDALELPDRFEETVHRLLVPDFLRHEEAPAERIEIALPAGAFFRCLGEEEVTSVVQVGPLVEMAFKTAGEETEVVLLDVRLVFLGHEDVLLVDDGIVRQYLDCLGSCAVHGLILGGRYRKDFR